MRKGEESRKRIIAAAEELFDRRGYANTSVQDILDALKISKGGFYHYFETKMELLTEVCRRRTEEWYGQGVEYVRSLRVGPVEKLNETLRLMNMLDKGAPGLHGLFAELDAQGESALPRQEFRDITIKILTPLVVEILFAGMEEGEFTVRRPAETAKLLVLMALDINDEGARMITAAGDKTEVVMDVLELLGAYRESVELLVNAPYGSIDIFDMADMVSAITRVANAQKATGA